MQTTEENTNQTPQMHTGRRQKLRKRFAKNGLDNFNPTEVLEFALGFCVPRKDTNPTAHHLLDGFGSLPAILDAQPKDLAKVAGVGEQTATFLHFLKEMQIYLAKQRLYQFRIITPHQAEDFVVPLMRTYTSEQCILVCLDQGGRVTNIHAMTDNELDQVHVNVREIVSIVTATKTAQVVLAHNHLNVSALPSMEDMQLTRRLALTFNNLGILFLDHLIVSADETYSFHCAGMLDILQEANPHI